MAVQRAAKRTGLAGFMRKLAIAGGVLVRQGSYARSTPTQARVDRDLLKEQEEENAGALAMFLDLAWKDIQTNPSTLEPYTEEMSSEDDELLAGVLVD